jgi:hypothetical protein
MRFLVFRIEEQRPFPRFLRPVFNRGQGKRREVKRFSRSATASRPRSCTGVAAKAGIFMGMSPVKNRSRFGKNIPFNLAGQPRATTAAGNFEPDVSPGPVSPDRLFVKKHNTNQ